MSNLIKSTRATLDISQAKFGVWLAKEIGRALPFSESRISEWENGKYSPRKKVRDACMPIVAELLATNAVVAVAKCLGKDIIKEQLAPDLRAVRDGIKEWIEDIS
ncbi:MAG: hypothetical protein COA63_000755 [Methylophaga sp.]|nr:hypothetical protein [Methylophaga sp.]